MVYVRMHYIQGLGPPGARDVKKSLSVIEHLIRAHAVAYRILHSAVKIDQPPPNVSIAQYVPAFRPCRWWWPMDYWAAAFAGRVFNDAMLEALTEGRWRVPFVATRKVSEAKGTLDFLGMNFYDRQFVSCAPLSDGWPVNSCDLGHHARRVRERTSLGWDVHPPSFRDALLGLRRWGLPILVTENGAYMTDDKRRWSYLLGHLQALACAMRRGAQVIGYCYWSLLDNFEWAEGFTPRFGLIEVDYATQQRRVRESARRYAEVCRANRL
jgi:beta-glucosidase